MSLIMTKKAISLDEFNELAEQHQLELLHKDGVFVGKINVDGTPVILFQLYSFYVEVHYKKYRKQIRHIHTTGNSDILKAYINQVRVRDLDVDNEKNI